MSRTRAKLFTSGGSQAVRLPKAFRFEGESEVSIRREGRTVVLEPVQLKRPRTPEEFRAFWEALDTLMEGEVMVRPPQPRWPEDEGSEVAAG